jgi:hypothetical protein
LVEKAGKKLDDDNTEKIIGKLLPSITGKFD